MIGGNAHAWGPRDGPATPHTDRRRRCLPVRRHGARVCRRRRRGGPRAARAHHRQADARDGRRDGTRRAFRRGAGRTVAGSAPPLRAGRIGRCRLRRPSAADRARPDHLAAVHRRADDRPAGPDAEPTAVLEIGTGSGYQAAVLAELASRGLLRSRSSRRSGSEARARCWPLGYRNVDVRIGDGYQGWPERRRSTPSSSPPRAHDVPQPLVDQLKPGGRHGDSGRAARRRAGPARDHEGRRRPPVKREELAVRFVPLTRER